jgi:NADH-quinone oxidoreductase subunit H
MSGILEAGIMLFHVMVVIIILFLVPIPFTWMERKVAGHIQQRLGPMRVGWHGVLQPLADGIKLLTKEDIIPDRADRLLFKIAPIISLVPPFAVFVAVPFADNLLLSDMNIGLLYILAVAGLGIYGVIFGGWASNSKYSLLGSIRSCAQLISYEIPMGFAVIGVMMLSQSMNLSDIVNAQADTWNIVYQPLGFFVFFIAGLAEAQRVPFDLAEAEGDLGAGYHTEYSGMRFSYFMISEYLVMLTISVLCVILFFGGWHGFLLPLPPLLWFTLKVGFFVYLFMWIRFTFPRYRYDQLMSIGWKVLFPLSLANILVTGFFIV